MGLPASGRCCRGTERLVARSALNTGGGATLQICRDSEPCPAAPDAPDAPVAPVAPDSPDSPGAQRWGCRGPGAAGGGRPAHLCTALRTRGCPCSTAQPAGGGPALLPAEEGTQPSPLPRQPQGKGIALPLPRQRHRETPVGHRGAAAQALQIGGAELWLPDLRIPPLAITYPPPIPPPEAHPTSAIF